MLELQLQRRFFAFGAGAGREGGARSLYADGDVILVGHRGTPGACRRRRKSKRRGEGEGRTPTAMNPNHEEVLFGLALEKPTDKHPTFLGVKLGMDICESLPPKQVASARITTKLDFARERAH